MAPVTAQWLKRAVIMVFAVVCCARSTTARDCTTTDLLGTLVSEAGDLVNVVTNCFNEVDMIPVQQNQTFEWLEDNLHDLCHHSCYTVVESVLGSLEEMNCDLQLGLFLSLINTIPNVPSTTVTQLRGVLQLLTASGISGISSQQFGMVHRIVQDGCVSVSNPGVGLTNMTCASEFWDLANTSSVDFEIICRDGISEQCDSIIQDFSAFYNSLATTLCTSNAGSNLNLLCNGPRDPDAIRERLMQKCQSSAFASSRPGQALQSTTARLPKTAGSHGSGTPQSFTNHLSTAIPGRSKTDSSNSPDHADSSITPDHADSSIAPDLVTAKPVAHDGSSGRVSWYTFASAAAGVAVVVAAIVVVSRRVMKRKQGGPSYTPLQDMQSSSNPNFVSGKLSFDTYENDDNDVELVNV